MSSGDLGRIGWIATIDDSQLLPSLRTAYAKLQAEVESRGIKIPLTTDMGGVGSRPTTFGTAQQGVPGAGPSLVSAGSSFAVNKPVAPNSGFAYIDNAWRAQRIRERMAYTGSNVVSQAEGAILRRDAAERASAYESASERVARNWDMAALAQQKQEERDAARVTSPAFPARFALTMGLLAGHELIRSNIAQQQGAFESGIVTTRAEQLKAEVGAIQKSYSGFFGSIIGTAKDLFGVGPESLSLEANRALALTSSQDKLRFATLASGLSSASAAAIASGDTFGARRAQINEAQVGMQQRRDQIGFLQSRLQETRAQGYYESTGAILSASAMDRGETATRKVMTYSFAVQGSERMTLQNELKTLQTELADIQNMTAAQITALNRDLRLARLGIQGRTTVSVATISANLFSGGSNVGPTLARMQAQNREAIEGAPPELKPGLMLAAMSEVGGYLSGVGRGTYLSARGAFFDNVSMRLRANEIRLATSGQPLQAGLAGIERERMEQGEAIRQRYADRPALIDPAISAMNSLMDARAAGERRDFGFQTSQINLGLSTQRELAQARLAQPRVHPAALDAISVAGQGLSAASQLYRGGRPEQAGASLMNTMLELQAVRQDFLNSFKARQIDLRAIDISNPQDQTNPATVLKQIQDKMDVIEKAINQLASD